MLGVWEEPKKDLAGLEKSDVGWMMPPCIHPLIHPPVQPASLQLHWSIGPHYYFRRTRGSTGAAVSRGTTKKQDKARTSSACVFPSLLSTLPSSKGIWGENSNLQVLYIACNTEENKENGNEFFLLSIFIYSLIASCMYVMYFDHILSITLSHSSPTCSEPFLPNLSLWPLSLLRVP